jgi:hypothetical protein
MVCSFSLFLLFIATLWLIEVQGEDMIQLLHSFCFCFWPSLPDWWHCIGKYLYLRKIFLDYVPPFDDCVLRWEGSQKYPSVLPCRCVWPSSCLKKDDTTLTTVSQSTRTCIGTVEEQKKDFYDYASGCMEAKAKAKVIS